jgi:hypothetical protein
VRVRFEGGPQELRRALAQWISSSRPWVERLTKSKAKGARG